MKIERPASRQFMPPDAKLVFKGIIFDVYQWEQKMFDGSAKKFERLKRGDGGTVVPVTTDKKIIILEQEQPGRPTFLSFPGGQMEKGEEAPDGVRRELLEETGYVSDEDLVLLEAFQPVIKMDWAIYTFIAHNCHKVSDPEPDAGEKIEMRLIAFEELLDMPDLIRQMGPDATTRFYEAKADPAKMAELKKLFGVA